METVRVIVALATVGFLGMVATAQQPALPKSAPAKPAAAVRPAGAASVYQPAATVQDLMAGVIGPASQVVFTAVSSEETPNGTKETAPQNDAEWRAVRRSALLMVEGANLLMMPGRRMALPEFAQQHNEGELPPAEIEIRVAKDRAAWNKFVVEFRKAALVALKATEGRKTKDFNPANEGVDTACENCHLRFWYPDQEKLLANAPKPG